MKTYLAIAIAAALTGCASNDYKSYTDAHTAAEAARYKVLSDVAATGGEGSKVAAVMAMAMGANQSNLRAPEAAGDTVLKWLGVLAPSIVQAYGITSNARVAERGSDNASKIAVSTNDTFRGIAGLIQAPGAITNSTDRHDVYTPAPVIAPAVPVVVVPPAPVITPPVVITPIVSGK